MGKSNTAQLALAKKHIGESCRGCCGMSSNCCCDFVYRAFKAGGNSSLFFAGRYVSYVPTAEPWLYANLADIPPYLAMPDDIITYDWNKNGTPDHIGLVDHRISDTEIHTLEANTTKAYVVAYRTRPITYVSGIFRPHFKATFDISKPLAIDGQFDYNSIAMLQKALGVKVDGILGKDTVKALQKRVGVAQDGSWKTKTSKAVQKMLGVKADGYFGEESVKALQKWCNANANMTPAPQPAPTPTPTPAPTPTPKPVADDKLTVDGYGGKKTVKALQKFLGIEVDGVIKGQSKSDAEYHESLVAVKYGKGGSITVKWLQRWLGMSDVDGYWGESTSKKLQKKLGVTQDGYFGTKSMKALQKYLNEHDKATYPPVKEKTLIDKMMDACEAQAKWMKNYIYKWLNRPTKANSKKHGTCVTFVAVVLQRIGVLKSGEAIWHNHGKVDGANDKMKVIYPKNQTLKSYKKKLKKGDIVMTGDKNSMEAGGNSHIFILSGKWDGDNPYIYDNNSATRVKNGKSAKHTFSGSNPIIAVVRLK